MEISRDLDSGVGANHECKRQPDYTKDSEVEKLAFKEFSLKLKANPSIPKAENSIFKDYNTPSSPSSDEDTQLDYSKFFIPTNPTPKPQLLPSSSTSSKPFSSPLVQESTTQDTQKRIASSILSKKIQIKRKIGAKPEPSILSTIESIENKEPTSTIAKVDQTEPTGERRAMEAGIKQTQESNGKSTLTRQDPFTVKYAPKSLEDIVGNTNQSRLIEKWLRPYTSENDWSKVSKKKVALISGPPGTGKTTAARVIVKTLGLRLIELNASDCRNKSFIQEKIVPFVNNTSIIDTHKVGKAVLLMDEVDGMSAGDEGGIAALIECIKVTKVPIVCVCNDRYSPSIKALVTYCFDVKFMRPTEKECLRVIEMINKEEDLKLTEKESQSVAGYCKGDLRFALNMLEFCRKKFFEGSSKDVMVSMNAFETVASFLSPSRSMKIELEHKVSMLLADYDFISMLIVENYVDVVRFEDLAEASESLVLSDLLMSKIKKEQEWTLLPDFAFACLYPACLSGTDGLFPKFPQQNSRPKSKVGKNKTNKEQIPSESETIQSLLNKLT